MTPTRTLAGLAAAAVACAAQAQSLTLSVFENADGVDVSGLSLTVDLIDNGSTVDFVWRNHSSVGNLVNIYVEATNSSVGLLSNPLLVGGAGTSYSPGSSPINPAGSIANFGGAWGGSFFSASPDTPQPNANAINPGETLTTRFDLNGSFSDLLDALSAPATLRLAGHVRSVGPDGQSSVWVVSPTPGTAGLLVMAGLAAARRRR
jgi:MYXO-CTERM domain-containing protein